MLRLVIALALALPAVPAAAASPAELREELAGLQRDDTRLQSIAWRVAHGNASLCPDPQPAVGLLPMDARGFKDPAAVRAALGLSGELGVGAVAQGSPADLGGVKAGDELVGIEGIDFAALPDVPPNSFARQVALVTRIDAQLVQHGQLALMLHTPGSVASRRVVLKAEPVCRSSFELLTSGDQAAADGQRVVISRRFLAGAPSDDEAAFVIGHELAHNILRHRALLDKLGRTPENYRQTERAADRLGLWLMANAGYDTATATSFMQRWARRRGPILFPGTTHDGWKTRQRTIAAELAVLNATPAKPDGELRDWRGLFPR
ncbi:MAG TPA: M48 family metallopeptidase [Novosphingobium sp.]|nr:M48 family metallopeptidase [Novosphingobium sp.]